MKTNKIISDLETKRIFIYLAIVFGVYYGLWLIAILLSDSAGNVIYSFLFLYGLDVSYGDNGCKETIFF